MFTNALSEVRPILVSSARTSFLLVTCSNGTRMTRAVLTAAAEQASFRSYWGLSRCSWLPLPECFGCAQAQGTDHTAEFCWVTIAFKWMERTKPGTLRSFFMAERINNGIQRKVGSIGPLQLTNHRVQNRRTGKQKSHWVKKKKGNHHLKL